MQRKFEQDNDDEDESEEESSEEEETSMPPLVKEIQEVADSLKKGPKRCEHLSFLTNMEQMMLKRCELKEILDSQKI